MAAGDSADGIECWLTFGGSYSRHIYAAGVGRRDSAWQYHAREYPEKDAMTDQLLDAPVHTIKPNAHQPRTRFDPAARQKLAGSVTQPGLIHRVIVIPEDDGRFTILAGEWRGWAMQPTGFSTIPVLVKDPVDDRAMTEIALIENVQREDLSVANEARAYDQLARDFGLSDEEIAQRVGKSRSTITNIRNLVRLPTPVLDLVGSDDTALRPRNGYKCGHLPQRFARALAPVAHLLPEEQLLAAAQKIAAPHPDGQYHDDPEDIISELVGSLTVELPHRDRCWDLAWPTTPMTITDAEGSLDVRDCKGCPHFIAAGRRCAYRRCFNAKTQLYAHHELERVAKNTGIPTAAETESVTILNIDWSNEDKIKRWLAKPAEHLRLLPSHLSIAATITRSKFSDQPSSCWRQLIQQYPRVKRRMSALCERTKAKPPGRND